jgi:DNA-binding transcriptional ArsR family regulator
MATDILISLDDNKSKKIAEVLSNKTSIKILEFLSSKEGTVTDIAHELKIAVNTTDYNIKKLIESGLIEKKSFWWSVKGKKMPTYAVANKRIIISPKSFKSLRQYGLAFLFTGLIAIMAKAYSVFNSSRIYAKSMIGYSNILVKETTNLVYDAVPEAAGKMTEPIISSTYSSWMVGPIGWFLIGAWFSILLLIILSYINERRSKK